MVVEEFRINYKSWLFIGEALEQFTEKYEKSGMIGQWLIDRFFRSAYQLLLPRISELEKVLEVGCGPGYSSLRIRKWLQASTQFTGSDLSAELTLNAKKLNPSIFFIQQSIYELAHCDQSFDLVVVLEVLEHLEDPCRALTELQRVSSRYVLLSTPREPIWRSLNFCRGKYLSALGNTPGHIQHWSTTGLKKTVAPYFDVIDMAKPLPWTIVLLRPRRSSHGT